MDFNLNNTLMKMEIKNEPFEEDPDFDPDFWYNFDCFTKKEELVENEILDDGETILNFSQQCNAKIEGQIDEKNKPSNQLDEISHSEFPRVLLQKLDVNINDKVQIYKMDKTRCLLKIYRSCKNEVHFEDIICHNDFIEGNQNNVDSFFTREVEKSAENASHLVSPLITVLPGKKFPEIVEKSKKKQLKNSKTVYKIRNICKKFICHICNYKTHLRCHLMRHLKIHEKTVSSTYCCRHCSYFTNRIDSLKKRILNHESLFKCSECNFITGNKRSISRHMLIHAGEKAFKCRFCKFKTNSKGYLKIHESDHSGEKKFMCSECCYKTNCKKNLIRHVLNHTGTKAYKCHDCSYQTNDISHLKRHKRSKRHRKAFPY